MTVKLIDVLSNKKYGPLWGYSISDRIRRYKHRQTCHEARLKLFKGK